jgi:hypothetical protein
VGDIKSHPNLANISVTVGMVKVSKFSTIIAVRRQHKRHGRLVLSCSFPYNPDNSTNSITTYKVHLNAFYHRVSFLTTTTPVSGQNSKRLSQLIELALVKNSPLISSKSHSFRNFFYFFFFLYF